MVPTPADLAREFAARSRFAAAPIQPPPNPYDDDRDPVTIDPALLLPAAPPPSSPLTAQHLAPENTLAPQAAESSRSRGARRSAPIRSPSPAPVASSSAAPARAHHAPMPVRQMIVQPTPFNFPPPPPPQPAPEPLSTSWVPSPPAEYPISPAWLSTWAEFMFSAPLFPSGGATAPLSLPMTIAPPVPEPSTRRVSKRSSRVPRVTPAGPSAAPVAPSARMASSAPVMPSAAHAPVAAPTLPSATPQIAPLTRLPPPQHHMEKAAADALMGTIHANSAGRFVCPVPGCGEDVSRRDALKRHLMALKVPCPQGCGKTIARGNLHDAMDRHLNLSCEETPAATRAHNHALFKERNAAREVDESSRPSKRRRVAPES